MECYTDTVPEDNPGSNPGTQLTQIFRDLEFRYDIFVISFIFQNKKS